MHQKGPFATYPATVLVLLSIMLAFTPLFLIPALAFATSENILAKIFRY